MAGSQKVTGSSPVTSTNPPPTPAAPPVRVVAPRTRLWEIDALRGVAVLGMIAFHFAWDWAYVHDRHLGPDARYFSGAIAATFITLLGLSIALDRARVRGAGGSRCAAPPTASR